MPNSYKLVLELHYPDSRMEYEVPRVQTPSAGARLTNVYDIIGRTDYSPLRVTMLKMLSYSVWKNHPEATSIRAVFGFIREPTPDEFKHGVRESYEFLYAYDFSFSDLTVPSAP